MAVTYTIEESFTGKRSITVPDPEGDKTEEINVNDVQVKFKSDSPDVTHIRYVNVCYDSDGKYDEEATKARCAEVAAGVETKINLGVIS